MDVLDPFSIIQISMLGSLADVLDYQQKEKRDSRAEDTKISQCSVLQYHSTPVIITSAMKSGTLGTEQGCP